MVNILVKVSYSGEEEVKWKPAL